MIDTLIYGLCGVLLGGVLCALSSGKIQLVPKTVPQKPAAIAKGNLRPASAVPLGLSFSESLSLMKVGFRMYRGEWIDESYITAQIPDSHSKMTAPYLYRHSNHFVIPYTPSNIDLFAHDWKVDYPSEE